MNTLIVFTIEMFQQNITFRSPNSMLRTACQIDRNVVLQETHLQTLWRQLTRECTNTYNLFYFGHYNSSPYVCIELFFSFLPPKPSIEIIFDTNFGVAREKKIAYILAKIFGELWNALC